jgi:ABC-2 type transport system permease protein
VLFEPRTEAEVEYLLTSGEVQFVVTIPENFARKLVRGERPVLLVEADATDPIATANAIATLNMLSLTALNRDLQGSLESLQGKDPPLSSVSTGVTTPKVSPRTTSCPACWG